MNKIVTIDSPKMSILSVYVSQYSNEEEEGMINCSKSTNEIIDELEPMASFSQDEILTYMDDAAFHCEWTRGELKWAMYQRPPKGGGANDPTS